MRARIASSTRAIITHETVTTECAEAGVRATPIDGSVGRARTRQDSYAARLPIVSAGTDRLLDS